MLTAFSIKGCCEDIAQTFGSCDKQPLRCQNDSNVCTGDCHGDWEKVTEDSGVCVFPKQCKASTTKCIAHCHGRWYYSMIFTYYRDYFLSNLCYEYKYNQKL